MRIKMIEFEATGEELKTNRTLMEAVADAVAAVVDAIGNVTLPPEEVDGGENADEDDA